MSGRGMRVRESVPKQNFDACWPRWFVRGAARHGTKRHDTARQLGNQSSISTPEREAGSLQVAGRQQAVAATENERKKKWQRTPIARAAAKDGHTDGHSHNRTTTTTSTTSERRLNGEERKGKERRAMWRWERDWKSDQVSGEWPAVSGQWCTSEHVIVPFEGHRHGNFRRAEMGPHGGRGAHWKQYSHSTCTSTVPLYSISYGSVQYSL